jgi:hypothetical protein
MRGYPVFILPVLLLALLGCTGVPEPVDRREIGASSSIPGPVGGPIVLAPEVGIGALTNAILALGPGVDPEEAARAARLAYDYTEVLVIEYEIVDPPIIHNMKVNAGLKPRGLCWHWAEDIERRLKAENFRTLDIHRAIANAGFDFRIDHSTAIISRKGDGMHDGIVLDPWRTGGDLVWVPTTRDTYAWEPQREVFARKAERLAQAQ